MRLLSTVVIFTVLLFSIAGFHHAFALIEGFERINFKLDHNPTICAVEPPPDSNFTSIGNRMLTQTEYAVIDWYTKLNTSLGTPASHNPIWKITLVKIFLWQQNTFDYSICDIVINYKEKPDDPKLQTEIGGVTRYDYEHKKDSIEIYYLQVNVNAVQNETRDANYIYTTTNWTPYYTGYAIGDAQLGMILRHEIGHALGLGHFFSDDPTMLPQWTRGEVSLPSIMIPTVIAIGNSHFDITPYDIYEFKSKYGNNGFGEEIHIQNSTKIPDWIKLNAREWAKGSLTNDDFIKGLQYLVKEKIINVPSINSSPSHFLTQIPLWLKNNAGWWADDQITDDEFVNGIQYLIWHGVIQV